MTTINEEKILIDVLIESTRAYEKNAMTEDLYNALETAMGSLPIAVVVSCCQIAAGVLAEQKKNG
jgi:hypothetical protein